MSTIIYSEGIVAASICTDDPVAEALESVRSQTHGTRWQVSSDPLFRQGQTNPCPCEQEPGRLHYLLEC